MSKHDVDIARINTGAAKFGSFMETVRHLSGRATTLAAIWMFFDGLNKVIAGRDAATIDAVSRLVAEMKLGSVMGYAIAAVCGAGWYFERKGKKRAIREKSRYQAMVEQDDPYRTSSGLTETGETPAVEDRG